LPDFPTLTSYVVRKSEKSVSPEAGVADFMGFNFVNFGASQEVFSSEGVRP